MLLLSLLFSTGDKSLNLDYTHTQTEVGGVIMCVYIYVNESVHQKVLGYIKRST